MSKRNKYLLFGALIVLIGYITGYFQKSSFPSQSTTASIQDRVSSPSASLVVTRVIDGDTIVIEGDKHVRLIGMDTPELIGSTATKCYGTEAKDYAEKLLTGQMIRLEKDVSETDKYGRLLRYVYLGDEMINDKLIREGYARVATYPPDVKYQQAFSDSEKYARENNLGLWKNCQ